MPTRLAVVPAPDGGHYLTADGVVQSHVHSDPTVLVIPYMREIADDIDALRPGTLRVLHLGAGALTLARYISATRYGSHQTVIDSDKSLPRLVQRQLPYEQHNLRWLTVKADRYLGLVRPACVDVIVVDLFDGDRQIGFDYDLATRALAPGGLLLVHNYFRNEQRHSIGVTRWQPSAARAAEAGSAEGAAR